MAAKLLDLVANVFFHDVKRKESAGRGHLERVARRKNRPNRRLMMRFIFSSRNGIALPRQVSEANDGKRQKKN